MSDMPTSQEKSDPVSSPLSNPTNKQPEQSSISESTLSATQKNSLGIKIILGMAVVVGFFGIYIYINGSNIRNVVTQYTPQNDQFLDTEKGDQIKKFDSQEAFRDFVSQARQTTPLNSFLGGTFSRAEMFGMPMAMEDAKVSATNAQPQRISETNVQVKGIDEPDIIKTNGKQLFYAPEQYGNIRPLMMTDPAMGVAESSMIAPIDYPQPRTQIIEAFPPQSLEKLGLLDESGELLLHGNKLIIIGYNKVTGFDVSNPNDPKQAWQYTLDDRNTIVTARLYQGKLYLVQRSYIDESVPCPLVLMKGTSEITMPCTDIYYPVSGANIDSTFTIHTLDTNSGVIADSVAFLGATGSSVVYMSGDNIFISYSMSGDVVKFMYGFFNEAARDLASEDLIIKLNQLRTLDISQQAKLTELSVLIQKFRQSRSQDDLLKMETEFSNRIKDYVGKHGRELELTGVVRVDSTNLDIKASGSFPGQLLNQFSMDEHDSHLRVVTTINNQTMFGGSDSFNDLYVLNKNLEIVGQIQGLGLDERIYSARFIGNRGYMVTFKQIDPFFVFDLSDPKNPQKTGELKIPGFSSYLHPLKDNIILGVGQEGAQVKLSLFDVFDPSNPKEVSKYMLDEYWTDVQNNHHAFLHDEKQGVFFIPGSKGAYILGYKNDQLSLVKAVGDVQARRALFIDNYLYVVGNDRIVVLNENDWTRVNVLDL